MTILCCILIGYLIGTINPAYIIGKLRGIDVRKEGSKNAGASNAFIIFGKVLGIFVVFFDIGKACFAIALTDTLFPTFTWSYALTASACILGHIFPFYMKFKGGKGLATLGGAVLMFDPRVLLIMLAIAVVIAFASKYICMVSISASVAFPFVYGIMEKDIIGALILAVSMAAIFGKHFHNIKRIRSGTEARLTMLWNKEKEIQRIQNNERGKTK